MSCLILCGLYLTGGVAHLDHVRSPGTDPLHNTWSHNIAAYFDQVKP